MMKFTLQPNDSDDTGPPQHSLTIDNDRHGLVDSDDHSHVEQQQQQQIITVVPIEKDAPNSEKYDLLNLI